ncbi:cytochrome c-type biogenesis protein [Roseivivax sp. CAU 1761]
MSRALLRAALLAAGLGLAGQGAGAVQPDEMLADPALEARARAISEGLRCLVCQNESIDESNAPLARDLRLMVRERLSAGDSDAEVVAFLVERYGEFVLLAPTTEGWNRLLWAAGPLMFLTALGTGGLYLRRRARARPEAEAALTAEERARLEALLGERDAR